MSARSRDLHVGDFVYVEANEAIPADMVLLLSSNEEGIAYMETSQLDGYAIVFPSECALSFVLRVCRVSCGAASYHSSAERRILSSARCRR
jgi:hypothetical protein